MPVNSSIVVVNSTPLILLQKIGHLNLLESLYSRVLIPQAVYDEVIVGGADKISNDFISENP